MSAKSELTDAYALLHEVQPLVFWGEHYQKQKAAGLLFELDFPVYPKSRDILANSPHMRQLRDHFASRTDEFHELLAGFCEGGAAR